MAPRRRMVLAAAVGVALIAGATVAGPRARAGATAAPPAPGWYATSHQAAAGVELLSIRRDEPLARAQVAVIPRTALYRLRTVLADEQLIGSGRATTSDLCGRVHCHAAVNGDRWELDGHDAGRLVGAVALAGELVATQPRPPADPYAHLLVGHDGSLRGTIEFPIPVGPEIEAGHMTLPVDVNRQPMPQRTSVITRRYSDETRTPPGTVEYILQANGDPTGPQTLTPLGRRAGSGPIPPGGVVVAANGTQSIDQAEAWWQAVQQTGAATFRNGLGGTREVIGGSPLLLKDGAYWFPTDRGDGRQPRTVVGWDATRLWLVTVDGRRDGWSEGLTYVETAQLLRWLGATDALNLDGGGSASFVGFGALRNRPSDGTQRRVASALVIMPPENRIGRPPAARTLEPSCPTGRVPVHRFVDAVSGVHAPAIDCVAWWNVAAGSGPDTYDPSKPVRRDQMASFLARYLYVAGVPFPPNAPDAFPDDDRSIHEPFIDALAAMGVIGGRGDGTFGPRSSVSRGQMATFIARSVAAVNGAPLAHTTDFFADDSGDVHEPNVNKVTEAGIAGGTGDGRYRTAQAVTRDQMASFLVRSLALAVESGRATPPA